MAEDKLLAQHVLQKLGIQTPFPKNELRSKGVSEPPYSLSKNTEPFTNTKGFLILLNLSYTSTSFHNFWITDLLSDFLLIGLALDIFQYFWRISLALVWYLRKKKCVFTSLFLVNDRWKYPNVSGNIIQLKKLRLTNIHILTWKLCILETKLSNKIFLC